MWKPLWTNVFIIGLHLLMLCVYRQIDSLLIHTCGVMLSYVYMYMYVHVNKSKEGKANRGIQGRQRNFKEKAELP